MCDRYFGNELVRSSWLTHVVIAFNFTLSQAGDNLINAAVL